MFRSPLIDAAVVIVILLLIVGPKKLPQLGRGLGDGMREFKEGITGEHNKPSDEGKVSLHQANPMPGSEDRRPAESSPERRA